LDYGDGNHHLELRRQYRYDNFMPDLNGRRYKSYKLVCELGKLAGVDLDHLNALDNGGGGNYAAFTPRIAEFLFNAGYTAQAADLLQRTLWWGARMPYWGDSFVANQVEYRRDTPLQSDISAPAGAQCIIFGLFGVKVQAGGEVLIEPKALQWSPQTKLKGLKITGESIDIAVDGRNFEVKVGARTLRAKIGDTIRVRRAELSTV
jgi:hypothetical protein